MMLIVNEKHFYASVKLRHIDKFICDRTDDFAQKTFFAAQKV